MTRKEKRRIKITREEILRIERQIRREEFVEEGAYDGRLGPRIHTDKRKEKDKRKCRERVRWTEDD